MSKRKRGGDRQVPLTEVKSTWGKLPEDHFGYASDEERRAKRGLEDWELVEYIPESQRSVPKWFLAVVAVVLLVAVGLSFPFWGDRPGYERSWVNWGFAAALVYISVAATFVYFMVNLYGSKLGGRLDSDKQGAEEGAQHGEPATGPTASPAASGGSAEAGSSAGEASGRPERQG